MASNNVIRAASRVVPLGIRASAGRQWYFHQHYSSALFAAVNSRLVEELPRNQLQRSALFPSIHHHYSTETSSDESLLGIIQSEIQCAVESHEEDQAEEVPEGFPFKIEDHPGQRTITLTREYQGEAIRVEVLMTSLVTGEDNDDIDEEGQQMANQSSIPLIVRTSKKSGPFLEFSCTAYPDEIAIDSLSVRDPENSEDQIAYEGPDFADLDENLQKAFHRYLEIRGIKPSTTNFLHGYMIDKDTREYITWMKKLQGFVQA